MVYTIYNIESDPVVNLKNFTFEGKVDGNQVEVEYTEWAGDDIWKVDDSEARQGSISSTILGGGHQQKSSYEITALRASHEIISFRAFWKGVNSGTDYSQSYICGFSEGATIGNPAGNMYAAWIIQIDRTVSGMELILKCAVHDDPNTYTTTILDTVNYDDESWIGVRIDFNYTDRTARFFYDRGESGIGTGTGYWKQVYLYEFIDTSLPENIVFEHWGGHTGTPAYDHVYIDDIIIGYQARSPDYTPTKAWFVRRLSEIGYGYMIIPDKDVDFSSYYDLQEQGIKIYDDNWNRIFHGMITTPHVETDGIRLDFKEITQQLADRKCKRDYTAEKGTVTETGTV